jgi:peroxin-6
LFPSVTKTNISRFTLHPDLSLKRFSQSLPFTYTGADMYALCSDAMLKAITRQARLVDEKVKTYNATHSPPITIAWFFDHLATNEDTAVMVTEQDYLDAHRELVPSVSADELRHYETVRATFEGAGKSDDDAKKQNVRPSANGRAPPSATNSIDLKGKGKAKAPIDEAEAMVIRTENIDLDGTTDESTGGSGSGSSGKGKGKAKAHASRDSVHIAEGGFGEAAMDEDLYE